MEYWARITREGRHWLAAFPELPGCQTFASSEGKLKAMAKEACEGWLKAQLQLRRIPPFAKAHRGPDWLVVRIDPVLAVKVALRQARAEAGLTQAELASRLGITQQAVAKLEDPDRNVELATVARVVEELGYELNVGVVPA